VSGNIWCVSYSWENSLQTPAAVQHQYVGRDCWWCLVGLHVLSQATTAESSSYMICQSYWKMYHWQSEHECGTCMMVLRAVRDVHSSTSCPLDRYRRTHFMASMSARFESSGLSPVGTPKNPCVCCCFWQRRGTSHCGCLSDYLQLPRHLWTDAAVHDETCRDVHWNPTKDILSTFHKCTLSAITDRLNVSQHILIRTVFLVLLCGTCALGLSAHFSYSLYISAFSPCLIACSPTGLSSWNSEGRVMKDDSTIHLIFLNPLSSTRLSFAWV
jgi:hypothetical protein